MTLPLFFVPDLRDAAQLEGDSQVILGGAEGRHAAKSMRLAVGEELQLTDGVGLRAVGRVEEVAGDSLVVRVSSVVRESPRSPAVTVVQALAKAGRDEMAVEICTELGADRFIPWQAERSIVRWDAKKSEKGRAKWVSQAVAAAKQARRVYFPTVTEVVNSRQLADWMADAPQVLVCHEEATTAIESLQFASEVAVVIGPEGGISADEMALFERAGAVPVSLGQNVLRTSTAGALALAAISIVSGRMA